MSFVVLVKLWSLAAGWRLDKSPFRNVWFACACLQLALQLIRIATLQWVRNHSHHARKDLTTWCDCARVRIRLWMMWCVSSFLLLWPLRFSWWILCIARVYIWCVHNRIMFWMSHTDILYYLWDIYSFALGLFEYLLFARWDEVHWFGRGSAGEGVRE